MDTNKTTGDLHLVKVQKSCLRRNAALINDGFKHCHEPNKDYKGNRHSEEEGQAWFNQENQSGGLVDNSGGARFPLGQSWAIWLHST